MIHGKYHGNTSYLCGNVDVGTQEFAGTGNRVNDGQMRQTDELQMMTSCRGRTSQLHKRIAQNKMMSCQRMAMTNDVENSSSLFFQISCSQGILNSSRLSCSLLLRSLVYMYLSQLMRNFTNYLKCIAISS